MKPYEEGLQLEGFGEISTAVAALEFAGGLPELPEELRQPAQKLAATIDSERRALEKIVPRQDATADGQAGEAETFLDVEVAKDAGLLQAALGFAAVYHPDELFSRSAVEMIDGYAEAEFRGTLEP